MNEFLITILMVNYNCADFTLNNLYCLKKLTKNKFKVIIRDNFSKISDYLKLKKYIAHYPNIELYRVEDFNYKGSTAHGIAINELMERIDTKYGVICDPDCTFLIKHWDEILIKNLDEKYPIIGTQAPVGYGSNKPNDFPYLFGFFFYTNIMQDLQIDFRPNYKDEYFKDTGFQIRDKFLNSGYNGKLLIFKSTRDFKSGPFHKLICAEYYLENVEGIFGSHFSRGSSLGINKYKKSRKIFKIPITGQYLLKIKGKKEKKEWIKICRKLVDIN